MAGPNVVTAGIFAGNIGQPTGQTVTSVDPFDLTQPPDWSQLLVNPQTIIGPDPPASGGIQYLDNAAVIDASGTTTRTLSTKPIMVDGCTVVLLSSGNLNPLATVTPPTGFTSIGTRIDNASNTHVDIFTKFVASAATEAGVTWTITSSGTDKGVHQFITFTGVDSTTPFHLQSGVAEAGAGTSPWTHTTPSITPTVANTVLIWTVVDRQTTVGSYSATLDYTRDNNPFNTGGTNAIAQITRISDQVLTGTYSRSVTVTGGGTYNNAVMWIGALNPAATGTNFTDTETDNSGLTDAASPVMAFGQAPTDTAGATDAVSTALAYARTQDDPAGLTDAATAASSFARQQDDTTGLTDAVTSFVAKTQQVDDPAGITDSTATALAYARTQDDPAGTTDSVSTAAAYARQQDDTAGITDAILTIFGKVSQFDDPTGITDAFATTLAFSRPQTDDSGLTDLASTALSFVRSLTDTTGITDSVSFTNGPASTNYTAQFDDDSGITDAVTGVIGPGFFTFKTPTKNHAERSLGKLMGRISIPTGISVLRTGLVVVQIEGPSTDDIDAADAVYLGGHDYTVTAAEAAILTAAGYGAFLS